MAGFLPDAFFFAGAFLLAEVLDLDLALLDFLTDPVLDGDFFAGPLDRRFFDAVVLPSFLSDIS